MSASSSVYRGGSGGGPFEVKWFKGISLANLSHWSFESMKTTKGVLTGYRFSFQSSVGDWVRNLEAIWWASPEVAGPFVEQFKAAMARFAATAGPVDVAGQLRALRALVDDGVITNEDMDRAKDLFLGRAPDQRQVMERSLRSLYDLRKAGVLDQIEFDIKKRDILATTK